MVKTHSVYWVNLSPTIGSEINKKRPCVVISPREMNAHLNTVIVAPLTSTIKDYPTRVNVRVDGKKGSIALDQIRTIDKSRLAGLITSLGPKTSAEIKTVLQNMFF